MQKLNTALKHVFLAIGATVLCSMSAAQASATEVSPATLESGVPEENVIAAVMPETLPGLESFVDGAVEGMMAQHPALPGVTVSVVKDGQIVLLRGYGYADFESKTPVDPERTLFRIGSITKTFTGLAVMQLVDQGLLDLDADVNTYLTEVEIPEAFGEPITLRHLLAHRAGFEDGTAGHLFVRDSDDTLPMAEYLNKHMTERVRPPGASSTYTNYGITLAGYIVEVVSGQDFASYLDEHIFGPLGMNHSTIREPMDNGDPRTMRPQLEALLATGYSKGADGKPVAKPHDLMGQVSPAGAISSTAADMARYMIARLANDRYDGDRLVSESMTEYMKKRPFDDRPLILDMAYAMAEGERDGYRMRWHNGGSSSFFSDMTMYPDLQLGIFMSTNSSDGGPLLSGTVPQLIFEHYYPSKLEFSTPEPPEDFVSRGQKYAGQYMPTRRSYTKLEKLQGLMGVWNVSVDDQGYLNLNIGPVNRKYVEIENGVFQTIENSDDGRNRASYLYFYDDDNGQPYRISVSTSDPVRVGYFGSPSFFFQSLGFTLFLSLFVLLSAWRRAGRGLDQTSGGKWASRCWTLAGLLVLVIVIGLALTAASLASGNLDPILFSWPPGPLKMSVIAATLVPIAAIVLVVLLRAAWKEPAWAGWRKLHYSVFALSLVFLAFALNEWNMVGFKY